jgi:hypothetical protein
MFSIQDVLVVVWSAEGSIACRAMCELTFASHAFRVTGAQSTTVKTEHNFLIRNYQNEYNTATSRRVASTAGI